MTTKTICPFCGQDPYEYVDVGVGMQPVDVTCCELGAEYFKPRQDRNYVEVDRHQFDQIAEVFRSLRTLGMDPNIDLY